MGIGEELRKLRAAAKLTQFQLASKSGVSLNTVSRIEVGETSAPDLDTLSRLAAALGVSTERLSAAFAPAQIGAEPPISPAEPRIVPSSDLTLVQINEVFDQFEATDEEQTEALKHMRGHAWKASAFQPDVGYLRGWLTARREMLAGKAAPKQASAGEQAAIEAARAGLPDRQKALAERGYIVQEPAGSEGAKPPIPKQHDAQADVAEPPKPAQARKRPIVQRPTKPKGRK